MTDPLPYTLDDTMSGEPVLEFAEPKLVEFYRSMFWDYNDSNAAQCDQLFAWLHNFRDSCMTRKDTIEPLFVSTFFKGTPSTMTMAATIIIGSHHREPWLYRRITHHGLSFLGRELSLHSRSHSFKAFVETVHSQLRIRIGYNRRDVYQEIEDRKRAADETAVVTKAKKTKPKMVDCSMCGVAGPERTAHLHQGKWIGDACCWDERLRTTE